MLVYERHCALPHSVADVLAYTGREQTFRRLLPPWERVRVVEHEGGMRAGARIVLRSGTLVRREWHAEVGEDDEVRRLVVSGSGVLCDYTQRVVERGQGASELIDHVQCRLPFSGLSSFAAGGVVTRRLERLFAYRQARTRNDLDRHAAWADRLNLTVAVAGSSGLIGSHLVDYLAGAGHRVVRLVRRPASCGDEIAWDPDEGILDPGSLEGVDAVVNLCGASLASVWTARRRDVLRSSRLRPTRTLVQAMARMERPPRVFVSASAVGYYGSRGDEKVSEETEAGAGFLAELCRDWEMAASEAAESGVRVVTPRFGLVLAAAGGVLAVMTPVFRTGLAGCVGDGRQWWSWVALDDLLGAVEWALHDAELSGAVNVVAPEPVTNRDFTNALARVLRRPALLRAPRPVVVALGGMPKEMLLASQRAVPGRLQERGYRFTLPTIDKALRFELGR